MFTGALVTLAILFVLITVYGYRTKAAWTGFTDFRHYKPDGQEFIRGKTLWDWLELLLVPGVLTVAALAFSAWQGDRDQRRTASQARLDRQLAIDQQREDALQTYIDRMETLVLAQHLRDSKPGSDVRVAARTRTLSTLARLDGERKGILVRFLAEAKLITKPQPAVDLTGANLDQMRLEEADLTNAYLQDVSLFQAELDGTDLSGAILDSAGIEKACLRRVRLLGAHIDRVFFTHSLMPDAVLVDTVGENVSFDHADLRGVVGWDVELPGATFNGAFVDQNTRIDGVKLAGASRSDPEAHLKPWWRHCFA